MSSVPMDTTTTSSTSHENKVDEGLYSRQLYVFGHEAQQKMQQSNVLIVGLKGLGVEIAKNVILAGVKSVSLLDDTPTTVSDLGSQFYLTENDIGKARASASLNKLQSLNPYVNTSVVDETLSDSLLSSGKYQIVVLTSSSLNEAKHYNHLCHQHNIKFIWCEIPGVVASLFVDMGDEHMVSDMTGEQPLRGLVSHVSNAEKGIVTCHEDHRHGLQDGDYVIFEEIEGMTELNNTEPQRVRVITPFTFSIGDTSKFHPYTGTKGAFQQVKVPVKMKFSAMSDEQIKCPSLSQEFGRERELHVFSLALSQFRESHNGQFPRPHSKEDADEVAKIAKEVGQKQEIQIDVDEKLMARMARCSSAELNPMCAFLGGVVGQEVLKAASGKFGPTQQWFYFDASHVLPSEDLEDLSQYAPSNSRYDSQIAVFGRELQHKIQSLSYFVVGAGAIGCEMLKNFALMGIGTSGNGKIHVTDMDTIERSNLNRQFLFRNPDVGQLKSVCAAREAMVMNPSLRIDAKSVRVAPATEDLYDDAFWESLDGVVTALDNVDARLYVDQRCVYYQKPMVDSGTLGTKGSMQVVVPFVTESYGSSRDPPEAEIPICTLKNFPFKIEHTIQWARDKFEGLFKGIPGDVNNYLTQANYLAELAKQQNEQLQKLSAIKKALVNDKPLSFEQCVQWARLLFETEYHHQIAQLLHAFPADSVTAEGTPFWSGPKRPPTPLRFDPSDPLHMDFIISASQLHAFNYGLQGEPESNKSYYLNVLSQFESQVPPFKPDTGAKIATTEAEAKEMADKVDDEHEVKVKTAISELPTPQSLVGYQLNPIDFEKDDDSNYHIAFITACSNLRARNYNIKESSRHQTKFIAGKIIPAIATTTALVTGVVCLELYKLAQKKTKIDDYRNFSCNLALPLFTASDPMPPATTVTNVKGSEWKWSQWDRIEVNIGDATLEELIKYFDEKYGLEINMLTHGAAMLFMNFGMPSKKIEERKKSKITDLVNSIGGYTFKEKEKYLILEASVNDADGEDLEIPYVRFQFKA